MEGSAAPERQGMAPSCLDSTLGLEVSKARFEKVNEDGGVAFKSSMEML